MTGDKESARLALAEHLRRFPMDDSGESPFPYALLTRLYLDLDEIDKVEAIVSRPVVGHLEEELPPMNSARIVLEREGPDAGILAMIAAYDQDSCNRCGQDLIGMAYDEAGRYPEAIDAFERYVSLPDPNTPWTHGLVRAAPVHFRLGELYEEAGDIDKSIEHYTEFAELWKDADSELQPRVEEALRRIESLLDLKAREPMAGNG